MKRKKGLVILVLIGLVSSLILSFNRIKVEANNKKVDFILDLEQIEELSEQSNKDLKWWFEKFEDLGVSSVSINEESFDSMIEDEKPLKVEIVDELKKDTGWKEKHSTELVEYLEEDGVDEYDLVAMTDSREMFEFIKKGLEERYSSRKFKVIESEDEYSFVLDGTIKEALYTQENVLIDNENVFYSQEKPLSGSKLIKLGLGYDEEKIDIIKESGLEPVLRTLTYVEKWLNKKHLETALDQYEQFDIDPKYMIFNGDEILGYPDNVDLVEDFMFENDMKVSLIESPVQREHLEQEGLNDLVKDLDYNAIRLFSMPEYIQQRYEYNNYEGAEEIENTMYRAVTERNIRVIYFKPFKLDTERYVTDFSEYQKTFESFENRIAKHNMTIGQADAMKPNQVNIVLKILLGFGILGGGMILLEELLKVKKKFANIIMVLGFIAIISTSIVIPNLSNTIFAMGSAVIFPSLSMIYFCKKLKEYYNSKNENGIKKTIVLGVKQLVIMVLISAIGSIFVGSVLSDIEYLLEMNIFRGVKLVQLVPIIIYIIAFIGYFGFKKEKNITDNKINSLEIKGIFNDKIKIGHAILAGAILYVGYIYIARTGHETNVQPSDLEIMIRNFLELKLLARPRIKEFLLAFPAVIIAIDFAFNRQRFGIFIAGLLISLGQTSVVNTFSHLRTPMYLSVARLCYGVVAGVIVGIIYLVIMKSGIKLAKFVRGEIFNE